MMLTTGELPDMIVGTNLDKNEVNELGGDGYFLVMMEYIDYMPNMKKYLEDEQFSGWANYQVAADGGLYGLSRVFPSRIGLATSLNTWINTEWLNRVGMDEPTSLDEFYEVLKAFKEQDANGNGDPNDEIPLGMQIDCGRGFRLQYAILAAHGIYLNEQGIMLFVDQKTGLPQMASLTEEYKEYLKYMHKLYKEELVEQSLFTITNEERIEKASKDIYGVVSDYSGLVTALGGAVDGNPFLKYELLGGFTSAYSDEAVHVWGNGGYANKSRTYISADTEYPELCCQLVDFFFADENLITAEFGEEGITFEYVEDAFGNKVPQYINDWKAGTVQLNEGFNMVRTSAVNMIVEGSDDATLDAMIADESMLYSSQAQFEKELRSLDKIVYPFPDMVYSAEVNERRSTLQSDLSSLVNTYEAAFILGEKDIDADWNQYQADLKAAGVEEFMQIVTDTYKEFMGK